MNRFIPARAGNTRSSTSPRTSSPVHPRSRGEHGRRGCDQILGRGSSPLARGTPRAGDGRGRPGRFIPARAGNTVPQRLRHRPKPVHPRSRGEHRPIEGIHDPLHGSSPLARGTPTQSGVRIVCLRFIPARAGNTPWPNDTLSDEHGSSPLARGTLERRQRGSGPVRFIPARAGNTAASRWGRRSTAVHPRSRGEHILVALMSPPHPGSSPLARGTLCHSQNQPMLNRFIPARAGNTRRQAARDACATVHPRSRGEHCLSR